MTFGVLLPVLTRETGFFSLTGFFTDCLTVRVGVGWRGRRGPCNIHSFRSFMSTIFRTAHVPGTMLGAKNTTTRRAQSLTSRGSQPGRHMTCYDVALIVENAECSNVPRRGN